MAPAEKILVIDRGHAELAYPADWKADPDPGGHLRIGDPAGTCRLEVSYLKLPPVPRDALPSLEKQMHMVLADVPTAKDSPVHTDDRGDAWLAWADYDPGGEPGLRTRLLLMSNGRFQALLTFNYKAVAGPAAVAAWDRIVATTRLGDGSQLARPEDHWSMRQREG